MSINPTTTPPNNTVSVSQTALRRLNETEYACEGNWRAPHLHLVESTVNALLKHPSNQLTLRGEGLQHLDSAGAWLLQSRIQQLQAQGIEVQLQGFKAAHQALLQLLQNHAKAVVQPSSTQSTNSLVRLGQATEAQWLALISVLAFVGETSLVLLRSIVQFWRIRWHAVFTNLYHTGVTAIPIVSLMAFLMGIVLAYQGGVQLRYYGANILVVDLVGVTFFRELGPLLTAIMVAGRSGSSYTAQIGTMKVTEEVDALRTIGISPLELLVLPKMLALLIMLPLLSALANFLGILGAMLISQLALDVNMYDFIERLEIAVPVTHYYIGIGKTPIFGLVIALVGCYQGFRASSSAESVGIHVTASVVQAIFLVIIVDALFSILFSWLRV